MARADRARDHRVSPNPPIRAPLPTTRRPRTHLPTRTAPYERHRYVALGARVTGDAAYRDLRGGRRHRGCGGPIRRSADTPGRGRGVRRASQATGIDVTLVRIGFVLLSLGSGVGILVYALAWLFVPLDGETSTIFSRAVSDCAGSDWSSPSSRCWWWCSPGRRLPHRLPGLDQLAALPGRRRPPSSSGATPARRSGSGSTTTWRPCSRTGAGRRPRWASGCGSWPVSLLGVAGSSSSSSGHPRTAALRPVGGALLVIAAIVVVFGPWWLRLVRDLMAERQARARAEERAQMAAHVHDSVLQTLALIQRSADDPQHVVRLARAQERELRSWLFEGTAPGPGRRGGRHPGRGHRRRSSARSRPTTGSPSRSWWSATAR